MNYKNLKIVKYLYIITLFILLAILALHCNIIQRDCPKKDCTENSTNCNATSNIENLNNQNNYEERLLQVNQLVEDGKKMLELGQANESRSFFHEALSVLPENEHALFGMAFSESQTTFEYCTSIMSLTIQVRALTNRTNKFSNTIHNNEKLKKAIRKLETIKTRITNEPFYKTDWFSNNTVLYKTENSNDENIDITPEYNDIKSQSDYVAELVNTLFDELAKTLEIAIEAYNKLKGKPDFKWEINKQIPIFLSVQQTSHLKGTIGPAEVYMFDALAKSLLSFIKYFGAHDFHGSIMDLILWLRGNNVGSDLSSIEPKIIQMLETDESFLNLRPDNLGKEYFLEKQKIYADILSNAISSFEFAQNNDHIEIINENPDLQLEELKQNILYVDKDLNGDTYLFADILKLEDYLPSKPVYYQARLIKEDDLILFENLKNNIMGIGSEEPIAFTKDLITVLGTMFVLMDSFGFLKWLNLDLGLGGLLTPELLTTYIDMKLPDGLAIKYSSFYENPRSLRDILPVWIEDSNNNKRFLIEWECPLELEDNGYPDGSGDLICKSEENLIDTVHFVGTEYEIPSDGTASIYPYIAFKDPTFSGSFFINPKELGIEGGNDAYEPATQMSFNIYLGHLLGVLSSFLN